MKRNAPAFLLVALLLVLTSCQAGSLFAGFGDAGTGSGSRPNILLIITDDQRFGTMEFMPQTQARIFEEGVTFSQAYITTPLCCPSRSSILTGMYAHNHYVLNNWDTLEKPTFVEALHENGYFTGLVGKYLNTYPTKIDDAPRPEYDYWAVTAKAEYYDPQFNVNGTPDTYEGYMTYLERDFAVEFLRIAAERDQPFLLVFSTRSPHNPALPAPGDETLFVDLPPHRPPSFAEADLSDKPNWIQERKPLSEEDVAEVDELRLKQLQSLHSADQAIDSLLTELDELGVEEDTIVIFLSDNGRLWGEHGFDTKYFAYEENSHVPFAIRYPSLVRNARVDDRLVANIDIAPTLYDLAGIPIPPDVDGESLVPLLEGKRTRNWREYLIIEGWAKPALEGPPYRAIHTGRYVYVEWEGDKSELYDLEEDPFQLTNVAGDPAYEDIETEMRQRFEEASESIEPTPSPQP